MAGEKHGMGSYTCQDYRAEMRLLGLRHRLAEDKNIDGAEKMAIEAEIARIEREMELS